MGHKPTDASESHGCGKGVKGQEAKGASRSYA